MQSPLFVSSLREHSQEQNKKGSQRRAEPVERRKQPFPRLALRRAGLASYLFRLCTYFGLAKILFAIHASLERLLQGCETAKAESIFLTIRQTIDESFPGVASVKERKTEAGVSAHHRGGRNDEERREDDAHPTTGREGRTSLWSVGQRTPNLSIIDRR
ncbi:MAG: hypothetical protein IH628_18105 [Proteobacteria bacterium]|nr:hypothetical protein [Pseudomonadota bacterium]